jgi:CheY-like chemotaxis protein
LAEMLHDDLQQLLVGAKFRLSSLNRSPQEDTRQAASQVEELIDESIERSRSLTGELSPPILHQGGLGPALEWLTVWMEQKHGLKVDLQIQDGVGVESEDMRVLLFQAVRELLFNTVKHANVKKAEVSLVGVDDHVEVTVSDIGVGFDPEASIPRQGRSGGFGLFSIRERLDLMGGKMEIDSAPGRGSRFTLRAPIVSPLAEEQTPAVSFAGVQEPRAAAATVAARPPDHRIRVLLVDDHVVVRQGLSALLAEEPDMEIVAEASDGPTAIEMVRRLLPDVVTMDINMPGMDGIEATKIICAEFPGIKVIGMSMFSETERADAMREAGAVNYLAKSGPSDALIAAIRDCAGPK